MILSQRQYEILTSQTSIPLLASSALPIIPSLVPSYQPSEIRSSQQSGVPSDTPSSSLTSLLVNIQSDLSTTVPAKVKNIETDTSTEVKNIDTDTPIEVQNIMTGTLTEVRIIETDAQPIKTLSVRPSFARSANPSSIPSSFPSKIPSFGPTFIESINTLTRAQKDSFCGQKISESNQSTENTAAQIDCYVMYNIIKEVLIRRLFLVGNIRILQTKYIQEIAITTTFTSKVDV